MGVRVTGNDRLRLEVEWSRIDGVWKLIRGKGNFKIFSNFKKYI